MQQQVLQSMHMLGQHGPPLHMPPFPGHGPHSGGATLQHLQLAAAMAAQQALGSGGYFGVGGGGGFNNPAVAAAAAAAAAAVMRPSDDRFGGECCARRSGTATLQTLRASLVPQFMYHALPGRVSSEKTKAESVQLVLNRASIFQCLRYCVALLCRTGIWFLHT